MMKFAVFLLMLVAVVNSDEGEGTILLPGNDGEGNFLVADDAGEVNFLVPNKVQEGEDRDMFLANGGDYSVVTHNVMESELDPITAMEVALPPRMARLSLNVGSICSTCKLLLGVESRLVAVSGAVRVQEIKYSKSGITIRAIRVNPLGTTAASIRLQGGVGTNSAVITITSRVSAGFHYLVEIWGN